MQKDCSTLENNQSQFGRTIDLLGDDGFKALQDAFVVIVGLGGVGCHASVSLVRSGLGKIRLVDFDLLTESSLNRHVFATRADVGRPKAEIMRDHILAVNPDCEVEIVKEFFHNDTAEEILKDNPDYIIDAIDSFTPKVALLRYAAENKLKIVSSMGASGHMDPTKILSADISETHTCPLARVVRRKLRQQGVSRGITTIFSTESPAPTLPPDTSDNTEWRGRQRNQLASLGVIPGIFGYALSGIVITEISGYNHTGN